MHKMQGRIVFLFSAAAYNIYEHYGSCRIGVSREREQKGDKIAITSYNSPPIAHCFYVPASLSYITADKPFSTFIARIKISRSVSREREPHVSASR
jgi:hypothetical protein